MSNLNDVITYGTAKFRVSKNITSENLNYFNDLPVGTILSYLGNSNTPPATYLFCDGSAISRTMYSDLFAILGTTYGSGDGTTTFNLPNLTGKFLEGNATAGINKEAGLPNITGNFPTAIPSSTTNEFSQWNGIIYSQSNTQTNITTGSGPRLMSIRFDASHDSDIYGNSTTVQPSSITVRYIIKAFNEQTFESSLIDVTQYASDLSTRLQRQQIPAFNKKIIITTSQTWLTPINGWYKFTLKGGGGGGAGGICTSSYRVGGAGGGEGGTKFVTKYLNKNDTVSIVIGAGGTGSSKSSTNMNIALSGGNTTITIGNNIYTAGGGGGGESGGGKGGTGDIIGCPGIMQNVVDATGASAIGSNGGGQGGGTYLYAAYDGGGGAGGLGSSSGLNSTTDGFNGGSGYCCIEYFDDNV